MVEFNFFNAICNVLVCMESLSLSDVSVGDGVEIIFIINGILFYLNKNITRVLVDWHGDCLLHDSNHATPH